MDCSVIICTHNPRPDYLKRVLETRLKTCEFSSLRIIVVASVSITSRVAE
jgi:glycosyltransferase involved in cell wall biosynthesis